MSFCTKLRAALIVAFAVATTVEALYWLRVPAVHLRAGFAPSTMSLSDGGVRFARMERVTDERGRETYVRRVYDEQGGSLADEPELKTEVYVVPPTWEYLHERPQSSRFARTNERRFVANADETPPPYAVEVFVDHVAFERRHPGDRIGQDEAEIRETQSRMKEWPVAASLLRPIDAGRPWTRVRRWNHDGAPFVRDVRAPVVGVGQTVAETLGHVLSLVRPPALTVASFVLPGSRDLDDYFTRWLLDPDVAGGAEIGWFAASLAVAALCGALARRQALRRTPAARDVLFWAIVGAAFGFVGLVLVAILMPKSHVAACACGRRRAVHVETCPNCAARWPSPAATGVEVFA